ncbi:NAD(P)H-binding protein [Streptomyces sp. NBC_00963]|uniref:SDR family oxidoreductase n=1 Tax=Streptomyces sp. NBC_00963 TaxID=2903697 RepID=UPI00386E5157|nr:NAD(P)H-binding protein [Streptomyces sp. NBC_00963]
MTVLVTGSRGKVGSALIPLLHGKGVDVRAASAAPGRLSLPDGVAAVRCDLHDPATFPAALDGADAVFLYAEPSQIGAFVQQAETAGVQHIVLLSSSSVLGPEASESAIAATHLAVEQALAASPIETTFLRPGAFAGNALQWKWALQSAGTIDLPCPGSYSDPIHERDIAESAYAALTEPALRGQAYHLTGPQSLTFTEQIAALEAATGRAIPFRRVAPDAWKESVSPYLPAAAADSLLHYWATSDGVPTTVTDQVEILTGHPARTFATWAAENAAAFTAAPSTAAGPTATGPATA